MKTISALAIVLFVGASWCSASLPTSAQSASGLRQRAVEARRQTRKFARQLQHHMIDAIRSRGWRAGVNAYRAGVKDIADDIAAAQGLEIKRTSLKLRNSASKPDAWELKILKSFVKQAFHGADINALEHYEVVNTPDGGRVFRYMRGIAVKESCLACHGSELKIQVREEVARNYPDDKAIGLKADQFYGAYTVKQRLD